MQFGFSYSFTKKGPGRRHRAPEWLREARRTWRAAYNLRLSPHKMTVRIQTMKGHFITISNHELRGIRRPR